VALLFLDQFTASRQARSVCAGSAGTLEAAPWPGQCPRIAARDRARRRVKRQGPLSSPTSDWAPMTAPGRSYIRAGGIL